jgi:tRNA threonylcarbamoyladenosine biosynthesis protein TsaE
MQKIIEKQIVTNSPEETRDLGRRIGSLLKPGHAIFLTGELGSGKTAFVQGLALGLGVPESYYVTSPTYTIINEYPGRVPLYHMDLYRLGDESEIFDLGIEEMMDGKGVIVVEWPDRLPQGFIDAQILIHIDMLAGDSRKYSFIISDVDLDYQI